jgi:hypothetical protein
MHKILGVRLGDMKLGGTKPDIGGAAAKLVGLRMCEDIDVIPSAGGAQGLSENVLTPAMER